MVEVEASGSGTQLDKDHAPETNGRMAICRRCGFRTTGEANDRHASVDVQEDRVNRWLDARAHAGRVAKARGLLGS